MKQFFIGILVMVMTTATYETYGHGYTYQPYYNNGGYYNNSGYFYHPGGGLLSAITDWVFGRPSYSYSHIYYQPRIIQPIQYVAPVQTVQPQLIYVQPQQPAPVYVVTTTPQAPVVQTIQLPSAGCTSTWVDDNNNPILVNGQIYTISVPCR